LVIPAHARRYPSGNHVEVEAKRANVATLAYIAAPRQPLRITILGVLLVTLASS
jgi:hypothetical protein